MLKSILVLLVFFASQGAVAQTDVQPRLADDAPFGASEKPDGTTNIEVVINDFKAASRQTREYPLEKLSEAYVEDSSNPALKLRKMWSNEKGTIIALQGLNRRGQKFSAIIDIDSVYLFDTKQSRQHQVILHLGGTQIAGRDKKKLLQVLPQEEVYLFFDAIDDYQPHSLRYTNFTGQTDRYFDVIDPRFMERYNETYEKARGGSVEAMKSFLQEFARNDPEERAQKVFYNLIKALRGQGNFDGHLQAYQLVRDPADEKAAGSLARSEEQQARLAAAVAVVRQAEQLKQAEVRKAQEARAAELRKREDARAAESKRQEEIRLVEQKAAQAKADEEKCMRTPACRQAWVAEQEKCRSSILSCRSQCDHFTGAGGSSGSFFGGLTASLLARGCYAGCKCNSGLGALLGKVNSMAAENQSSSSSATKQAKRPAADESVPSSNSGSKRATASSNGEGGPASFECKIYCKSVDGPVTYKTVTATSRKEAARIVGDNADEICANAGKSYASRVELPESQCYRK